MSLLLGEQRQMVRMEAQDELCHPGSGARCLWHAGPCLHLFHRFQSLLLPTLAGSLAGGRWLKGAGFSS